MFLKARSFGVKVVREREGRKGYTLRRERMDGRGKGCIVEDTAVFRNTMFGRGDTPPKNFHLTWIRIVTAYPVFLWPYCGLRVQSIAMCVS